MHPDRIVPVTSSILSPAALVSEVAASYDIGYPVECMLLNPGVNDTYLIKTSIERYILRVYRFGWRTISDILYEMDVLTHLAGKGVPVSTPMARRDGTVVQTVRAPEGERYAALFTYAPGAPGPWPADAAYSRFYGSALAIIHNSLDDFSSVQPRFQLDLAYLIDRPVQTTLPFLNGQPVEAAYLTTLATKLTERVLRRSALLERGVCHGDCHGTNCHVTADGAVTFFDFDSGGFGWRVYDLANFRWASALNGAGDTAWDAFLEGYTAQRQVRAVDMELLPVFVLLRQIWLLGLHTGNAATSGIGWLNPDYFERWFTFMREWESKHAV